MAEGEGFDPLGWVAPSPDFEQSRFWPDNASGSRKRPESRNLVLAPVAVPLPDHSPLDYSLDSGSRIVHAGGRLRGSQSRASRPRQFGGTAP